MMTPAFVPAVMAVDGVKVNVAVVVVAAADDIVAEASVIAKPVNAAIAGNVPVEVVSRRTTGVAIRLFDVAATMLLTAFCPLVGVENFVTVNVTAVPAA